MLNIYEIVDGLFTLLDEVSSSLTSEQIARFNGLVNEYYSYCLSSEKES